MKSSGRFSDKRTQIYDFGDHFLVVCPQCGNKVEVLMIAEPQPDQSALFLPRRQLELDLIFSKDGNASLLTKIKLEIVPEIRERYSVFIVLLPLVAIPLL